MAFDCAVLLRVVADDIASLRRCDVGRLLDLAADIGQAELVAVVAFVRARRPDLVGEVEDCLTELGCF
jgi:hypothetical protein